MKLSILLILLFISSCQDYNSNTFDRDRYGEIELTGSPEFKQAYPIVQNNCMNCHQHAQWASYTDQQDWVTNSNLVIPGDANGSQLIIRTKNSGRPNSDMPVGGSALSTADFEILRTWINSGY